MSQDNLENLEISTNEIAEEATKSPDSSKDENSLSDDPLKKLQELEKQNLELQKRLEHAKKKYERDVSGAKNQATTTESHDILSLHSTLKKLENQGLELEGAHDQLQIIMKATGLTPDKAVDHELFTSWKNEKIRQQKLANASIASRGGNNTNPSDKKTTTDEKIANYLNQYGAQL